MTPPLVFELTDEEAAVASARLAWRTSLAGGLLARHLGPLAAFMLSVLFCAILGWTGLVSRRAAEIGLIVSAGAYMTYRLWTRRRFFAARRAAVAWAETLRRAGPATLTADDSGFRLIASGLDRAWLFADGLDIETVAGLVYVWPKTGAPLVWPERAHADAEQAEAALALARGRSSVARPAYVDDDD
jgi:hypothetical protein